MVCGYDTILITLPLVVGESCFFEACDLEKKIADKTFTVEK